ncbi:MAG TPA: VCBS repeat-containing protein [Polyangium sp.]|nr:VCBS repeat-containing protein [Polyangium sp.]
MKYHRFDLVRRQALPMSLLLVSTIGCTNLDFLEPNTCGNLVVENDIGEDCDGGENCGAPNSAHQCRFTCEKAAEQCDQEHGYHCGADAVCRRPAGSFTPIRTTTTESAKGMLVGDINADGCAEVVVGANRSTTVHAFSSIFSTACIESEQTLNTNRPDPEKSSLPLAALADLDSTEDTGRMSLLSPARSASSDGLSMYFTNGTPTLSPILFPRFLRGGANTRIVSAKMRGSTVALLFETSSDGISSDVTLIVDAQKAPQTFPKAYAQNVTDIAAVLATDIDPTVNSAPDVTCDEIVIAKKGDTKLELYKLCENATMNGFSKMQSPQITLTGTTVRDKGAAIYGSDVNGDLITDIITNTSNKSTNPPVNKVHVAYGVGDGRFHSSPPQPTPLPMADQKADAIGDPMANQAVAKEGIFVALEFNPMHPGIDYYSPPCPPLDTFSSPTCATIPGDCEAVVSDIDADGDMDVVISEGQGVDLAIHRQTNGAFNVTFLETACPPHHLGTGDFDGDGVNDIAFFDQSSKGDDGFTTSLSIVYGNDHAAPDTPVNSGRFDEATGLAVIHSTPPGTGSQIGITRSTGGQNMGGQNMRGSAVGIVEIGSERTAVAPYYVTSDIMGAQAIDTSTLVGQTPGNFGPSGAPGVAVLTQSSTEDLSLWLVQTNDDAGSLRAITKAVTADIPCSATAGCLLAAIPRKKQSGNLLVLGSTQSVIYRATTDGFESDAKVAHEAYTFQSTIANTNPAKYYPSPLVADIDLDEIIDVVALATNGALVGFFGNGNDGFTPIELISPPSCWDTATGYGKAGCGNYVAAQIDVDGDGRLDLAIAGSELPGVDPTISIAAYRVEGQKLHPIDVSIAADKLGASTDFLALGAADIDSDGVRDLVFMPNSNYFTVLRGLPVHP